ncbi:MAG: hypothetical protein PHW07_07845 [Sulfurospirillaceae bacterium]|nr:hypothetical protein [Sulfurospirillaceae bacterium]
MKIKYAGPKAVISEKGVDFDMTKEDKYVYLNIAIQLIKALDNEYVSGREYVYNGEMKRLSDAEMFDFFVKNFSDATQFLEEAEASANAYVEEELKHVEANARLSEDEKDIYRNNIKIMRSYVIQRSINKSIYYHIVNKLGDILREGRVDYVTAPMYQKFAHVFHTVQGVLQFFRPAIASKVDIFEKSGELFVKLSVFNR